MATNNPPSGITEEHEYEFGEANTPPQVQEKLDNEETVPSEPTPMTNQVPQQQQLRLPGKDLSDMFSRLAETMVYAIAPPDSHVNRIVEVCSALEVAPADISVDHYITLFNEACWVNRQLRAYRHRTKLYSLEERVLLNAANALITQWREDVNTFIRSQQTQQKK